MADNGGISGPASPRTEEEKVGDRLDHLEDQEARESLERPPKRTMKKSETLMFWLWGVLAVWVLAVTVVIAVDEANDAVQAAERRQEACLHDLLIRDEEEATQKDIWTEVAGRYGTPEDVATINEFITDRYEMMAPPSACSNDVR